MSWQSISWSVLWHYSLKNLTLSLFKLCFNMFFRGENLCHRLIFFVFSGKFLLFSHLVPRDAEQAGLLLACILLRAPLWLWDRVCLCCGAWPQLQAGHLMPQGELLGKTLIQAFSGQWKICNNSKSLMEINNFQIILYVRTDLLSSFVVSCYLCMNQSLLWYCEHLWFSGQTHDSSKKGVN